MLIAHLSDLHLDCSSRARARVQRALEHIRALNPQPDLVLVTGDIAEHGAVEEYEQAAELFAGVDALMVPGNHDRRRPMRALLGLAESDEPITSVSRHGSARVLLADSVVPGQDHGFLAEESLELLNEAAAEPGLLVVAVHHPPLEIGSDLLDPIRLVEPERLIGPLTARRGPSVILCGHAHIAVASEVAGVPIRIAPGIASTLRLPYEPGANELDRDAEPAVVLHQIDDLGRAVSHFHTVR